MTDEILLEIVTPEKLAFSSMVEQVNIPGSEGQIGVLKGHTPLLSFVNIGELNFVKDEKRIYFAVNKGYVEVALNKVTVLVETAERSDAINKDRAQLAKERAHADLAKKKPGASDDYEILKAALARAISRLNVANRG